MNPNDRYEDLLEQAAGKLHTASLIAGEADGNIEEGIAFATGAILKQIVAARRGHTVRVTIRGKDEPNPDCPECTATMLFVPEGARGNIYGDDVYVCPTCAFTANASFDQ